MENNEKKNVQENYAPIKLSLLVTIAEKAKADYYADLIQAFGVNMQVITLAKGTAKAHMLEYLGLSDSEKAVIFSVIKESRVDDALYTLERKFETIKNGKGVALTLPLTSMIGKGVYAFLSGVSNAV